MANGQATAGLRGAHWDPIQLPSDLKTKVVSASTHDGASCTGILYQRKSSDTVVMAMHPREFLASHYLVPEILAGDAAVYVQAPRSIGNDIRLEHEVCLLDVAAGIRFLRELGFGRIVLLGNSGGASLFAFYIQQSLREPERRISETPAGRPVGLREAVLPQVDGLILVSPHAGQGQLLLSSLDPSVIDEADAFSRDADLFPFDPRNGFKRPPTSSDYSQEFVARYRAAQQTRCARIDAIAETAVRRRRDARQRIKDKTASAEDVAIAAHEPVITVWRTDADLRCWDTSLDPSARRYGSLWGADPFASNFGTIGFARTCTPSSWLSTWSGLKSNASFARCGEDLELPILMIVYDGDNSVFPREAAAIFEGLGSAEKYLRTLPGNHHGGPISATDARSGRAAAGEEIRAWLRQPH
jgi:pimeloyl-ACP methyl ester carboxylesterase